MINVERNKAGEFSYCNNARIIMIVVCDCHVITTAYNAILIAFAVSDKKTWARFDLQVALSDLSCVYCFHFNYKDKYFRT